MILSHRGMVDWFDLTRNCVYVNLDYNLDDQFPFRVQFLGLPMHIEPAHYINGPKNRHDFYVMQFISKSYPVISHRISWSCLSSNIVVLEKQIKFPGISWNKDSKQQKDFEVAFLEKFCRH